MATTHEVAIGDKEFEMGLMRSVEKACVGIWTRVQCACAQRSSKEEGQGTTEYAILVGVLVVIAILSITIFRGKIQELWTAIADGINDL